MRREPQTPDEWIVYTIRLLWSGDSQTPFEFPFGMGISHDDIDMERVDASLLASFKAERPHHDDDLSTIWTLIRG